MKKWVVLGALTETILSQSRYLRRSMYLAQSLFYFLPREKEIPDCTKELATLIDGRPRKRSYKQNDYSDKIILSRVIYGGNPKKFRKNSKKYV